MSIENNLASIAESLKTIAASMGNSRRTEVQPAPSMTPNAIPQMAQMPAVPMTPAPAPAAPMVPQMPAPVPAAPAVPAGAAPFSDAKGLMEYVMGKYKKLGPIKGGLIQNALSELGLHNINDLKAEQYGAFYMKVEAIV